MNFRTCYRCGQILVPDTLEKVVEAFKCVPCDLTILNICNDGEECEDCKGLQHCGECSYCVHGLMTRKYDNL